MSKKYVMPSFFAVAFVWFTTHFGGGFASGAQTVAYYVKFGWFAAFLPALSQLLEAFVFFFAWKYALDHNLFNYRSWANSFYKPVESIMANVFEIIFNLILVTATAVAFATGGATIEGVFGTPYILNTVVIAAIIFLLTIFGANVVRKAASYIAIAIIAGVLIIFVPNVIHSWPTIVKNISDLQTGVIPNTTSFWTALWKAIVYAGFQACCLGAYLSHTDALKDVNDAKKAAFWGFIINGAILTIATLGILAFYNDGILAEKVPTLFLVKNGIGSAWMMPLVSILILIGAVSTGVNLIYGIVNRLVAWLSRNENIDVSKDKQKTRSIFVSLVYVIITWCIAQFGLIPLVAKGYGTLGYIAVFVIILPILIRGIIGWKKPEATQK